MAKSSGILDWCMVRLGDDHNWWVREVSDPVRWDTDGLSIIDPRQVAHLIELVEPLRDPELIEAGKLKSLPLGAIAQGGIVDVD